MATPIIDLMSPDSGAAAGNTLITITGSNFSGTSTTVTFDGTLATSVTVNPAGTEISCRTPAHAAGGILARVIVDTRTSDPYAYTYLPLPTITEVYPNFGSTSGGEAVSILGSGFVTGRTSVTFNGVASTSVNVVYSTEMTCIVPATVPAGTAGNIAVRVVVDGATSTTSVNYNYVLPPTIATISETSGPTTGGQSIIITGSRFTGSDTRVVFGTSQVIPSEVTATQITVVTESHAPGTFPLKINVDGVFSDPGTFYTFVPPTPIIDSISPDFATRFGGETITINGSNLNGTTVTVTFGGTPATIESNSGTQITAIAPAHTVGTNLPLIVTVDGAESAPFLFTYTLCFKEGTKILTDKGYMLIQDLRKGDLVKTVSSDFKKIEHIGHSKMYHNANDIRSKNKLYTCPTSEYPELTEDLVITGCHSILVKQFKDHEQMEKTQDVLGKIYVTEAHYRLPACVDDRTKIFDEEGVHTIWHFSLENSNYYSNYGIYANGLLVETTSNRMMVELSGMTLL